MAGARILVIEDEPGTRQMTLDVLLALDETYEAAGVGDRETALQAVLRYRPDVVLLDLNLGRRFDGLDICREIRGNPAIANTGIIVFTSEPASEAEPMLLDAGADDYIRKPQFNPQMLASRVRAVLRRIRTEGPDALMRYGPLSLDPDTRMATVEGDPVGLTPTEFEILSKLLQNKHRAMRREELLERDGPEPKDGKVDRTVDVHVLSIRRKLGRHEWIVDTVFGVGYRLGVPPKAGAR